MRILILLLILMVAGCAPTATPSDPSVRIAVNAIEGGKGSVTIAWLNAVRPLVEQAAGRPLEIVQDGGSDESFKSRLVLDLYGRTGADIYTFDSLWTAQMASAGLLRPLDGWLGAWPEWKQYPDAMRRMGEYRGHVYVLPFQTDVRGLYYRKDLFARAGLPGQWRPKNWAEIFAAGEALKKLPGVTPIQWNASSAFGEAATMQGFYLTLLSAGGDLYNWRRRKWIGASDAIRRTLVFYRELYVNRRLADVGLQLDPKGRERSFERFRDGKIGIYPESTWMWREVLRPGSPWGIENRDDVVGWAPMPGGGMRGDPRRVSISGGDAFIVNPHSLSPERAWAALRALSSRESMEIRMKQSPFIPARQDLLDDASFRADKELAREVSESLAATRFRPGFPEYPRVSELVQRMGDQVIQGVPVDTALADYARNLKRVVGENKVE